MSLRRLRQAFAAPLIIGFALHTVTVLWVWRTWGYFGRANVLAWIDFPASLAYLHVEGDTLLTWSLIAGGLQWAFFTAALTLLIGRVARQRRA